MELNDSGSRERLARIGLTVALVAVAIRSFRSGKRLRAVLSGTAALALGYSTATGPRDTMEAEEIELPEVSTIPTREKGGEMHCSICGDRIVAGQGRRPHANHGTVHEACLGC